MAYSQEGLERLASFVKKARGTQSRRAFANKLGLSHPTIARIEQCEVQEPEIATLEILAPELGMTREEIIDLLKQETQQERVSDTAESLIPLIHNLPREEKAKLVKLLVDYLSSP